jgi:hypothetical protein
MPRHQRDGRGPGRLVQMRHPSSARCPCLIFSGTGHGQALLPDDEMDNPVVAQWFLCPRWRADVLLACACPPYKSSSGFYTLGDERVLLSPSGHRSRSRSSCFYAFGDGRVLLSQLRPPKRPSLAVSMPSVTGGCWCVPAGTRSSPHRPVSMPSVTGGCWCHLA